MYFTKPSGFLPGCHHLCLCLCTEMCELRTLGCVVESLLAIIDL